MISLKKLDAVATHKNKIKKYFGKKGIMAGKSALVIFSIYKQKNIHLQTVSVSLAHKE